jgi:acyl dehydratase
MEEKPETKDHESARKPYESPKLVVHGGLTRLTAGNALGLDSSGLKGPGAEYLRVAGVLKMEKKPETKDRESARKPYESPKLVVHGSLTRLTAGSAGGLDFLGSQGGPLTGPGRTRKGP